MPFVGIGLGVGRQRFGGGGFDADYQAVLDYATLQGYTLPSASQQALQNQLVLDLKTAGIWSKLDSFAVFATDGDADFALIDWINLSQYTAINSPTFTSNSGFTGNGTSAYMDTNFNPSTSGVNFIRDDASIYVYVKTAATVGIFKVLASYGINNLGMCNESNVRQRLNQASSNIPTAVDLGGTGMKSINRATSVGTELFNNTTQFSRTIASQPVINATTILLTGPNLFSNAEISMFAMGASLISQNTSFVNTYNNYINAI